MLPYQVKGLGIEPADLKAEAGTTATFQITLDLDSDQPAGRNCLRIEVLSPEGRPLGHYGQNVLTGTRSTKVSVGLARNDPSGTWRLRATDVATGTSATAAFQVEAGR
jgi:hypothetical protein